MSEFRGYLVRLNARPDFDALTPGEQHQLNAHFDPFAGEVNIDGVMIRWDYIEAVEVVEAARAQGPSGWLVRQLMGGKHYHVGIYYGRQEAVLSNVTYDIAAYIVKTVAFHAPNPVRYSGIEGITAIAHE